MQRAKETQSMRDSGHFISRMYFPSHDRAHAKLSAGIVPFVGTRKRKFRRNASAKGLQLNTRAYFGQRAFYLVIFNGFFLLKSCVSEEDVDKKITIAKFGGCLFISSTYSHVYFHNYSPLTFWTQLGSWNIHLVIWQTNKTPQKVIH